MAARSLACTAPSDRRDPGYCSRPDRGRPEHVVRLPSDQEFLDRYGDAIDDRVAEILDELLSERQSARPPQRAALLSVASLLLAAVAAAVLLRHDARAWAIWPAIALVCLAAAIAIRRPRRPAQSNTLKNLADLSHTSM
jgi:hypothetical protein